MIIFISKYNTATSTVSLAMEMQQLSGNKWHRVNKSKFQAAIGSGV